MNRVTRCLALGAMLLLSACAATPPKETAGPATAPSAGASLSRLVERYFDDWLALNPTSATAYSEHRYDDRLEMAPTPDYETTMRSLSHRYRDAVAKIDPAGLSEEDRLTRDMFLHDRDMEVAGERFPSRLMPFDQFNGGMPELLVLYGSGEGAQPFSTPDDYDRWIRRASQFPSWVDAAIAAMREGMARGVTVPRVTMVKAVSSLDLVVTPRIEDSLFYLPVTQMPTTWPAAERERLRAAMTALIGQTLDPAYTRLRDFVRDEYLPGCRETVGWSDLPDGAAWYAHIVADYTTEDDLPEDGAEQIHRTGLAEVARIRAGMEEVMRQVGFRGSLQDFFRYVKEEPSFYYTRPEDLIAAYEDIRRRVNAGLPRLFSHFPRADYVVKPIEAFRAEASAGAEYQAPAPDGSRPGTFYVNTFNLRAQPKFGMETLSLHEASPGHHFEGSIQMELTNLPRFRRFGGYVAYSEGWALYSESLGRELGLFRDPMSWYGRLSDEILRAMRLVVDTGLHAKGWSREQAIRYMQDNSSMAGSDIVAEVDRYIVWPGQALGYKIGDLKLQGLRRKYEAKLGGRFDIRDYHWQVLKDGELPFDVLEAKLDRWAEARTAAAR
jgi:uncharacterized protein (DUF885 family)